MSNLVFPSGQAGAYIDSKEPYQGVLVDEAASGKEYRQTWWTSPRWKYRVRFDLLRSAASSVQELQQLVMQFLRHAQGDSFLLDDPEDDSVTDMGFGVGDGATTSFQLQRAIGGKVTDRSGFSYAPQSKPYLNMVKNSSFETDTNADGLADSWAVYNNESATVPTFATIVPGANGGKAQRVSWGTNAAQTKGINQTGGTPAFVAGQWYTLAFLARASGSNIGQYLDHRTNAPNPSQKIFATSPPLTASWQRYAIQLFWNLGTTPTQEIYFTISLINGGGIPATFGDLDFDEMIVVAGQYDATTCPQPNATPAAATGIDAPAFFPSQSDGFEPVYELSAPPTVYQDGDWMGRRTIYPYTRSNLLPFSEQFDNAAWVKTNCSIVANAIAAPDGTTTADQFNEGAAVTVFHAIQQNTSPAEAQGELRCYSTFVKANNLPNILFRVNTSSAGIQFNLGTGVIDGPAAGGNLASGVITSPLWPGWYRIWFVNRVSATLGTGITLLGTLDGTYAATYTGTSRTFYAWGAMCERVSNLNGPTPYIPTPSSVAVTRTDYTLSALGLVTPSPVLPSGAYLSADFAFYKRVRLAQPGLPLQRICQLMWSSGLDLLSVRP